jgi:hypothetical protein
MRDHLSKRLEIFRSRRNKAFLQLRLLEYALHDELDPDRRAVLQARLLRLQQSMSTAMCRLSRFKLCPSNREIGAALGIPKGTVDSGLYWMKRKLTPLLQSNNAFSG